MDKNTKKFVESCINTFNLMEHQTTRTDTEFPWQFSSTNRTGERHYAIYCTPSIRTSKALIQACLRQVTSEDTRFVVIVLNLEDSDLEHAERLDYCLVSLEEIERFGEEMLDIRSRSGDEGRIILRP